MELLLAVWNLKWTVSVWSGGSLWWLTCVLVSLHYRPLTGLFCIENMFHPQNCPTAGPGATRLPRGHVVLSVSLDTPNWVLRKWISLVSVRNAVPRVAPKQRAPTATCNSLAGQPRSQQRNTCRKKPLSLPWAPSRTSFLWGKPGGVEALPLQLPVR